MKTSVLFGRVASPGKRAGRQKLWSGDVPSAKGEDLLLHGQRKRAADWVLGRGVQGRTSAVRGLIPLPGIPGRKQRSCNRRRAQKKTKPERATGGFAGDDSRPGPVLPQREVQHQLLYELYEAPRIFVWLHSSVRERSAGFPSSNEWWGEFPIRHVS